MPSPKNRSRIALLLSFAIAGASLATAQLSPSPTVKVLTYNVDEGTDFTEITSVLTNPTSTAGDFVAAVAATIAEVQSSNLPLRAQLIANEIANAHPDLVGLQEAAVWTFPDGQVDLLQKILQHLDELGQHYAAVVTVPEVQLNIAQLGVGFLDRDVILARTDKSALQILAIHQGHYSVVIPLPAFPPYLPATNLTRGWASVDARLNGTRFRFITTHLEDGTNPIPIFALVQGAQAIELVYGPAFTLLPTIIGGDFNTVANDPSNITFLTYRFMLANRFTDAWSTAHPNLAGLTCCQEDLQSSTSELTQRIDLVFTRGRVRVVAAQLVGDQIDATYGYWPSDHAAVYAVDAISKIF